MGTNQQTNHPSIRQT
jgi:hypothetical protein